MAAHDRRKLLLLLRRRASWIKPNAVVGDGDDGADQAARHDCAAERDVYPHHLSPHEAEPPALVPAPMPLAQPCLQPIKALPMMMQLSWGR